VTSALAYGRFATGMGDCLLQKLLGEIGHRGAVLIRTSVEVHVLGQHIEAARGGQHLHEEATVGGGGAKE
jgi:hypothetical protein